MKTMKQIFSDVGCLDLSTVEKRKVRKDFDLTKSYNVDVSECTIEEKKEVQQAFFDAGFQWLSTGKAYNNLDDVQYSNTTDQGTVTRYLLYGTNTDDCNMSAKEFLELVYEPGKQEMKQIIVNVEGLSTEEKNSMIEALAKIKSIKKCNPPHMDNVAALYGPSFDGINVGFNYHKEPNPTHTPQQVLEMVGMTKKRNVRKDFDPSKEYIVNVSGRNEEMKKEVQQAFFDAGILWQCGGSTYQHLHAMLYTNSLGDGLISGFCMYGSFTENCNMSAEEFLDLVYEPENQGHVHAELMALYAEDAKIHKEPWNLWEFRYSNGEWETFTSNPAWEYEVEYRRKPKTHYVHGIEIPDLRVALKYDDDFYLADPTSHDLVSLYRFDGDIKDQFWVDRGLAYQHTEEGKQAAILHAKIMLGIA